MQFMDSHTNIYICIFVYIVIYIYIYIYDWCSLGWPNHIKSINNIYLLTSISIWNCKISVWKHFIRPSHQSYYNNDWEEKVITFVVIISTLLEGDFSPPPPLEGSFSNLPKSLRLRKSILYSLYRLSTKTIKP